MLAPWKCHKVVRAGKILDVNQHDQKLEVENQDGESDIIPYEPTLVSRSIPSVGDYYIVYDDGYASWSPAKAFEEGYSPLE